MSRIFIFGAAHCSIFDCIFIELLSKLFHCLNEVLFLSI